MLSRVADSIFWMCRYTERAENIARLIDVNLNMSLDLGPEMEFQWAPLIATTGDQEEFKSRYGNCNQRNVIQFLTFDEENPNSVLSCLRNARENARTVREMISSQMWEELNKVYLHVRNAKHDSHVLESPFEFFNSIKQAGYLLEGVMFGTMSHGEAWHFARMGKLLERADKTSRILDVKYFLLLPNVNDVGTTLDVSQWASLLKSASALEMYRKSFGRITPRNVAAFLILDRDFPRTMYFCLLRGEQSLLAITGGSSGKFRTSAEQRMGRLRAEFDYAQIDEIIHHGLHEFIDAFQSKLNALGEAIHDTFFAIHPAEPHAANASVGQ
jgi:uncharacterized alpha-E superfamily protein